MNPIQLPVAVRAYTERVSPSKRRQVARAAGKANAKAPPDLLTRPMLVYDIETTTDAAQQLTFGSYRYFRPAKGKPGDYICATEGIFYADNLEERDPAALATLREYVAARRADVAPGFNSKLRLMSCSEFIGSVFYPSSYKYRVLTANFNTPFDVSRLAVAHGLARRGLAGGFSFTLLQYRDSRDNRRENRFRPRIAIKSIDSKRALKSFTSTAAPDEADLIPEGGQEPDRSYRFRGHFLDARTLAFALTNTSHSLESACREFGLPEGKSRVERHGIVTPEYIDYNRQDVKLTAELTAAMLKEFSRHPIGLLPTQAYSPASIGKAYLFAMGLQPLLKRQPDFPKEVLGYAMVAYYGGRAECRIRRTPVPVLYLDFLSMYPTVNTVVGSWDMLTADRIEVEDVTEEIQEWLSNVTLEQMFDPANWKKMHVLALVKPEGDVLPVRARHGRSQAWSISIKAVDSDTPIWYALPDLVTSRLLHPESKIPQVVKALRLVPKGRQPGLRPTKLRGAVEIDPNSQDFFKTVIEERYRVMHDPNMAEEERQSLGESMKGIANSTGYGIFAEFRTKDTARERNDGEETDSNGKVRVEVFGLERFTAEVDRPEEPGPWCFPPLAAVVTAGARLMLALLERCVTDAGGSFAFCDTDSMAIVSTESSRMIRCPGGVHRDLDQRETILPLSWEDVARMIERFEALKPYDPEVVQDSILKMEKENFALCPDGSVDRADCRQPYCYCIAAKRYVLYNLDEQGNPVLRKWSEHGLGHLMDPGGEDNPDKDSKRWIRVLWEGILADAMHKPYEQAGRLAGPACPRPVHGEQS